jgi:UDP-glucuronate decarboxylase
MHGFLHLMFGYTDDPNGGAVPWTSLSAQRRAVRELRVLAVVTGGAGFLGSHVCERLIADGYEVLCVDNFTTGRRDNVRGLLEHRNFALVDHDVVLPLDAEADRIYHLACPASPVQYQLTPVETIKANVIGTLNMLELAKRRGARLLLASTSEVYGSPKVHPQAEDYWGNVNPIGLRACYDEGKRVAETLCFDYHRQAGVDIRVTRIFNTFGPRMRPDDGRVVSNFIVRALQNEPIVIYGNGQQTRSFCYVDDLVEGIMRMMNQDRSTGPVNLGRPQELTVLALASLVIEVTGSRSTLEHAPLPSDDPCRRCPDIGLARELLGWEPNVEFRAGLERTVAYFEDCLRVGHHNQNSASPASLPVLV